LDNANDYWVEWTKHYDEQRFRDFTEVIYIKTEKDLGDDDDENVVIITPWNDKYINMEEDNPYGMEF
jgi:hypothetical protein